MILSYWKSVASVWEDEGLGVSEAAQLQLTPLPHQEGANVTSSDLANSIENFLSSEGVFGISDISRVE